MGSFERNHPKTSAVFLESSLDSGHGLCDDPTTPDKPRPRREEGYAPSSILPRFAGEEALQPVAVQLGTAVAPEETAGGGGGAEGEIQVREDEVFFQRLPSRE